ncbi:MAG: hypothetical protein AAF456_03060 [Planctomycetota bacterium]
MNFASLRTASILSFALILGLTGFANADQLDQQSQMNPTTSGWAISNRNAQTVTVGTSGYLSRIGIQINQSNGGASGDLFVEIWNVLGDGSPDVNPNGGGTPVAAQLIPGSSIPESSQVGSNVVVTYADFSAENLLFNAGDRFAILLRRTDLSNPGSTPWMIWSGGSSNFPNAYDGGSFYLYSPVNGWEQRAGDHGFQTYMTAIPEPASFGVIAFSGIALIRRKRS